MKISRTKYSSMPTPELLAIADQQGLNINELVREMMDRLEVCASKHLTEPPEQIDGQMRLF